MKHTVAIVFLLFFAHSFGQEVKLGLPVGHSIDGFEFYNSKKNLITYGDGIKIWDVKSGKPLISWNEHTTGISELAMNPSSDMIASNDQLKILLWDLQKEIVDSIPIDAWSVQPYCMTFDPTGRYLVFVGNLNDIYVYDTLKNTFKILSGSEPDGGYEGSLPGIEGSIRNLKFLSGDNVLITSSQDGFVRMWDYNKGKLKDEYSFNFSIDHLSLTADESHILIGGSVEDSVALLNLKNGSVRYKEIDPWGVYRCFFTTGGDYFITSTTNKLEVWSSDSFERIASMENDIFLTDNFSNYDDSSLLVFNASKCIKWNYRSNNREIISLSSSKESVEDWYFDMNSNSLTLLDYNDKLTTYSLSDGSIINTYRNHTLPIRSLERINDNNDFIVNQGGHFIVQNLLSGEFVSSLSQYQLSWYNSEGDNQITAICQDSTFRTIDLKSKEHESIFKFEYDIPRQAYLVDDSLLLCVNMYDIYYGKLELYRLSSGELIREWSYHGSLSSSDQLTKFERNKFIILDNFNGFFILDVTSDNMLKFPPIDQSLSGDNSGEVYDALARNSTGEIFCVWNEFELNVNDLIHHKFKIWDVLQKKYRIVDLESTSNLYHTFSISMTENDSLLILNNSNGTVSLFDMQKEKIIKSILLEQDNIWGGDFTHENRYYFSFSSNGALIALDVENGEKLLTQYIFDNDPNKWVHIYPSGLFDASPEAMELMYWTKGLEVIEFEQLKDRYWVPGLWKKVMNNEPLPSVRGMDELKLQPEVQLGEVKDGRLPITLTKRDGGYGKVSIWINGKEVINDARGADLDTTKATQTIYYSVKDHPFFTDTNTIEVRASSADGFVQGRGELLTVIREEKEKTSPNFYAVVIGVDQYANEAINLKFPSKDALAIAKSMELGAANLFGTDKNFVYTVTSTQGKHPDKENIQAVFQEISTKAKAEDVLLVYLSGHGVTWGGDQGDFYFLTADATAAHKEAYNDPVIRENNTVSTTEMVEWIKSIPALKQVMIIDACGSGKAVDNLIAARDVEASQIKAIDRMKDRTGMFVISGSAADAVSYEASQYGQGLLTYAILQGMKGAALKENKFVDVQTILDHARETVPQLAEGLGGIQEPQFLIPKGGSFDIGLLNETDRAMIPLAEPKKVYVRSNFIDVDELEDVMGLGTAVDEALNDLGSKGESSDAIWIDTKDYPNGCKISGSYTREGGMIHLRYKIRCGEEVFNNEIEAASTGELVSQLLKSLP